MKSIRQTEPLYDIVYICHLFKMFSISTLHIIYKIRVYNMISLINFPCIYKTVNKIQK
jgi:hypothetical protein